jgi:hypothetical protein
MTSFTVLYTSAAQFDIIHRISCRCCCDAGFAVTRLLQCKHLLTIAVRAILLSQFTLQIVALCEQLECLWLRKDIQTHLMWKHSDWHRYWELQNHSLRGLGKLQTFLKKLNMPHILQENLLGVIRPTTNTPQGLPQHATRPFLGLATSLTTNATCHKKSLPRFLSGKFVSSLSVCLTVHPKSKSY